MNAEEALAITIKHRKEAINRVMDTITKYANMGYTDMVIYKEGSKELDRCTKEDIKKIIKELESKGYSVIENKQFKYINISWENQNE